FLPSAYPLVVRAFPFQCHHGFAAFGECPVAPNPKLSGFNATTALLLSFTSCPSSSRISPFQCHHGFAAFDEVERLADELGLVSMPPRLCCFRGGFAYRPPGADLFQCHHGFAAFDGIPSPLFLKFPRFNATTALLLSPG
ncbi:hypothetical protein, partial [Thermoflexus sp.]|uniref:hypothetical protein n=1 Tax=Thermoflexus sp. TaxID=1969742 RepID=UPI002637460C